MFALPYTFTIGFTIYKCQWLFTNVIGFTFTDEILNGDLHFLCSATSKLPMNKLKSCSKISLEKWNKSLTLYSLIVIGLTFGTISLTSLYAGIFNADRMSLSDAKTSTNFCEPYLSHTWSSVVFLLVLENGICLPKVFVYLWDILRSGQIVSLDWRKI